MKHLVPPKKTLALTALLLALSSGAQAEPGVMLGVSHNFGGDTGITFKLLSTDRRDKLAAAVGVSYFPWAATHAWGFDTSLGYTFRHGALTVGYDWLNGQVQLGLGVANTKSRSSPAPAPLLAQTPAPIAAATPAPAPAASTPAPSPAPARAPAPAPTPAPTPAPAPAPAPAQDDPCAPRSFLIEKATAPSSCARG